MRGTQNPVRIVTPAAAVELGARRQFSFSSVFSGRHGSRSGVEAEEERAGLVGRNGGGRFV